MDPGDREGSRVFLCPAESANAPEQEQSGAEDTFRFLGGGFCWKRARDKERIRGVGLFVRKDDLRAGACELISEARLSD